MKETYTRRTALAISAGSAIAALSTVIAPRVRAIERIAPAMSSSIPISVRARQEVWRLATKTIPLTCQPHDIFGTRLMRHWVVDRTMERLAADAGALHTLAALVDHEVRFRTPAGFHIDGSMGKLRFNGTVPFGTYTLPSSPDWLWDTPPLGMFIQSEDGNWHYRRRIEGVGPERFPWMVAYIGYGA